MIAKRAAADQLDPAFMSEIDFPIVKRGFDPASVQAFAQAVGVEMSRLLEENRSLQAQLAAARSKASEPVYIEVPAAAAQVEAPAPLPVVAPAPAPAIAPSVLDMWGSETNRLLETARENVAHVMAQAEAEARGIVAKAELDAERIRRSALEDGERQSQAMRDQTASDLARAAVEREQIAEATRRSRLELGQLEQDKRLINGHLLAAKDAVTSALTAMESSNMVSLSTASASADVLTAASSYTVPTPIAPAPMPAPVVETPQPVLPAEAPTPERFVPPASNAGIGKLS